MQPLYRELLHLCFLCVFIPLYSDTDSLFRVEDEETGQIPMAYVVRAAGSELSAEQVIDFVADQVWLLELSSPLETLGLRENSNGLDIICRWLLTRK